MPFGRGDFGEYCTKKPCEICKPCGKCELLTFPDGAILLAYPQYMMPFGRTAPHKKEIPSPETPGRTAGGFNLGDHPAQVWKVSEVSANDMMSPSVISAVSSASRDLPFISVPFNELRSEM